MAEMFSSRPNLDLPCTKVDCIMCVCVCVCVCASVCVRFRCWPSLLTASSSTANIYTRCTRGNREFWLCNAHTVHSRRKTCVASSGSRVNPRLARVHTEFILDFVLRSHGHVLRPAATGWKKNPLPNPPIGVFENLIEIRSRVATHTENSPQTMSHSCSSDERGGRGWGIQPRVRTHTAILKTTEILQRDSFPSTDTLRAMTSTNWGNTDESRDQQRKTATTESGFGFCEKQRVFLWGGGVSMGRDPEYRP